MSVDDGRYVVSPCPLCGDEKDILFFHADAFRQYFRCESCGLIFVPSHYHLSCVEERAEYDKHQNSPDDAGYRRFLSRLYNPLQKLLSPGSLGLDFGCGPGPTLSLMFSESGHQVNVFDPFYANYPDVLALRYDFITASEVVEHFRRPGEEFTRLWQLLLPGGWLGLMTKLARDKTAFANWHYKNDPTHVCFFSRETLQWLAGVLGAEMQMIGADVVLFRKDGG